jgi:hypothetical protein
MGAVSGTVLVLICCGLVVVSGNLPVGARERGGGSGGRGFGSHQHIGHVVILVREEAALHVDAGVHHADHLALAADTYRGVHRTVEPLSGLADAATRPIVRVAGM